MSNVFTFRRYHFRMRQLAVRVNGLNGKQAKPSNGNSILDHTMEAPVTGSTSSLVSLISSNSCNYTKPLKYCPSNHSVEAIEFHRPADRQWILPNYPKNSKTAAFIVASSIYGQLLVVLCLTFFTAEIKIPAIPVHYFEAFYLYLYSVSLLFLFYVLFYLLHDVPKTDQNRNQQPNSKKKEKITESDKSHGSIFLRIGAVAFGLGTMIYNGLEFGSYFEIPMTSPCYSLLLAVNPFLQAAFTFAQMYFIFTYSRLSINKFKLIARLGLMHLVGTNICVWIRTLGKETLQVLSSQELTSSPSAALLEELIFPVRSPNGTALGNESRSSSSPAITSINNMSKSNPCQREQIMGSILADTSPYLYPFIVEYSLIGAAFLYVMWSSIGRGHRSYESSSLPSSPSTGVAIDNLSTSSRESSALVSHSLYSCLGSSKGLFCGFLFLVASITSLIIFFVLVHHETYKSLATLISDLTHSSLLILSCLAIIIAYSKVCKLRFQPGVPDTADGGLRDLLLRVAAFGLYLYSFFGVIAGAINLDSTEHLAVLITSSLTILQVTLQSLFIADVVCRKRSNHKQPGRQLITFLMIANFTLWVIYTFEMQKVEASPVQLRVYGFTAWALIIRITLPLSIFYRIHSTITFAEVWKNSYK